MPIKTKYVNYLKKDNSKRIETKKKFKLISEYIGKIEKSDAIVVVNNKRKH